MVSLKSFFLFASSLAVLLANCSPRIAARVSDRDYLIVQEGRYPGYVAIADGDPKVEERARPWRSEIEENPELLRRIAEKYFLLPASSSFRYMYVGRDSVHNRMILRYFAHDPHPVIMAGWQIQFVFDARTGRVGGVYTCEVPLE